MIFNIHTVAQDVEKIKSHLKAPFKNVNYSTFGGEEQVSILILVSLDPQSTWVNGYVENSKYTRFHLENDGSLEQFTLSQISTKFRKTKVKSVTDAITKINSYLGKVK